MTRIVEEDYRVVVKEGNAYLLSTVITPINEESHSSLFVSLSISNFM